MVEPMTIPPSGRKLRIQAMITNRTSEKQLYTFMGVPMNVIGGRNTSIDHLGRGYYLTKTNHDSTHIILLRITHRPL
jgi:outer membrane scaffolding protein for murein synthesis (MipA/OmpV family)